MLKVSVVIYGVKGGDEMKEKKFRSAYCGSSLWDIFDNGVVVGRAESRTHHDPKAPFVQSAKQISIETVGCVWSHGLSPEDLTVLFPGFCPISFRFSDGINDVIYHGEKPKTYEDTYGCVWPKNKFLLMAPKPGIPAKP